MGKIINLLMIGRTQTLLVLLNRAFDIAPFLEAFSK